MNKLQLSAKEVEALMKALFASDDDDAGTLHDKLVDTFGFTRFDGENVKTAEIVTYDD